VYDLDRPVHAVALVICRHDRHEAVLDEYVTILALHGVVMSDLQNLRRSDGLTSGDMHQQEDSFQNPRHPVEVCRVAARS
jgi:hypothetical protein